jgi:Lhr-like helicase
MPRKPEGSGRPCQAIEVFDIKNNLTTQYDSIRAAARALDISCNSIRSTFRKNRQKPYKNRYIFKK